MIKEYLCGLKNDLGCFLVENCRNLDLRIFIVIFGFSAIAYLIYRWTEKLSGKDFPKVYVLFHSWLYWSTLFICIAGLFIVPSYLSFQEKSKLVECGMNRGIANPTYKGNECDVLTYCKIRNDTVRQAFIVGIIISLWNGIFPFFQHLIKEERLKKQIFYYNCHALFCFNLFVPVMFLYLSPMG